MVYFFFVVSFPVLWKDAASIGNEVMVFAVSVELARK